MLVFSDRVRIAVLCSGFDTSTASQLPTCRRLDEFGQGRNGLSGGRGGNEVHLNVDLIWKWGIFTRNTVLAIWIAIGIILTIYLLGKFQLAHDSKPERLGVGRLMSAILSLAISFYLLTGLFVGMGELEAFLPLDTNRTATSSFNIPDSGWSG